MTANTRRVENMRGGKGHVIIEDILEEAAFRNKGRLFAKITLEPGCSIGYHEHHGESETFYILKGEGQYNDNGEVRAVRPGDVTFTPDASGHGMENAGGENLEFMALILYW